MNKGIERVMIVAAVVFVVLLYVFITQPAWVYGAEPRIDDQGNRPWCVVYAVCNAVEYQRQLEGLETPKNGFSKEWLYKECKKIDNLKPEGTLINYALQVAYEKGLCPADDYGKKDADKAAEQYKITTYTGIYVDVGQAKELIDKGNLILTNSRYIRDWNDGVVTKTDENSTVCHATYYMGYDEDYLVGVNSWGKDYGDNGKFKFANDCFYFPNVLGIWIFEVK
ncbi:MAG: hypothetical protein LLG05_18800 [Porphyromonadaceae bacterium]|nr:hypothetical protein [Porphyromonadaceae bacterium]